MLDRLVTLFFCGDVMTGRGVDQILPHPGDPRLHETYVKDARRYVDLAEAADGPIPRPVDFAWPWGDALEVLEDTSPDARIINLETSITRSEDAAEGKAVHYRMSPQNLPCLTVAHPDVCALANNHVLDFGVAGLTETLYTLAEAKIQAVGAGHNAAQARRPAKVEVGDGTRILVFSLGTTSSGIPPAWAASHERPGVNLLPDLSEATANDVAEHMQAEIRPGDIVVASIHWGTNWGYLVPPEQVRFAHDLIDRGVHVVHGHSSHHARPIEQYKGGLILYGCGDFIDDYEGISGYGEYRDDLRPMYFASVDPGGGTVVGLRIVTMRARQMRLHHAPASDVLYLRSLLEETSRDFGSRFALATDGTIVLEQT